MAVAALSLSPVAAIAQTSAKMTTTTTEKPSITTNPKNTDSTQCVQPAPGETHRRSTNCPKPTAAPTPTKTLPKSKTDKKTATPANATQTPPPATNAAQPCREIEYDIIHAERSAMRHQ
jgi:hypothetical protein